MFPAPTTNNQNFHKKILFSGQTRFIIVQRYATSESADRKEQQIR
jgi:hypothetical protein